jgi:hypothetical protein
MPLFHRGKGKLTVFVQALHKKGGIIACPFTNIGVRLVK